MSNVKKSPFRGEADSLILETRTEIIFCCGSDGSDIC